jgi:hypothetical protein
MKANILKTLAVCFILLTSTSCHLMWRWRGPCSFWPMPDPPVSGEKLPQTFTSVDGRFRFGLPRVDEAVDDGKGIKTFKWFVINVGQFQVGYFDAAGVVDTPDVSKRVLDNLRDSITSKAQGQLEVDTDLNLAGHPGREIRIKDDGGMQIQRFYLAGNRIYSASVFVAKRLDCKLDSAVKVLDTFEITE